MEKSCNINKPYPEIQIENKNIKNARILQNLFSGENSEFSAISTYSFQQIILSQTDLKTSQIIECISICEMKHYEILGELILLNGVYPYNEFYNFRGRKQFWNASFANYETGFKKFIKDNITAENKAIKDYTNAANRINDENIKAILNRIIEDEEHHIEIFSSLLG